MKRLCNNLLAGSLLALACTPASAQVQEITVHGAVYEKTESGRQLPLAGSIIAAPGLPLGTQADTNGTFSLTVPDSIKALIVSFAGYATDTIRLKNGDNIFHIVLQPSRMLKEVVIRNKQKTTEIGLLGVAKIENIGAGELLKAACCNLSESFETIPSIDVAYTDAVSGYKQIMMLGLAGPYTLITSENIPELRGLAAVTGLTYIPGYWIEGLQLSKGTGSVVNGYESVAGQINVALRDPFKDKKLLFELYQNSHGRTEANLIYRHEFNKRLAASLFINVKDQWLKTDENKDGFIDQPLGKNVIALSKWVYNGNKGWMIQGGIKGIYSSDIGGQWNYKKGMLQEAGNPWGYQLDMHRLEEWTKIGKMFMGHPGTSIGLQVSGTYHDQHATYGERSYDGTQKSVYSNLIFQTIINNTNNIIKGGISNVIDHYDEQFALQRYMRTEGVAGIFTEYSYSYLNKLNVVAGMRGDYNNLYGGFATPRLHIRYAPFKRTAIRASIGRAERTANIFAENMGLMASNRRFVIVNPETGKAYGLNPEIAWNTGISLTQKFRLDYREGTFSADYYYTNFKNQVVTDMENPQYVRFYNLSGLSFAHSFQAQLDYELIHNLNVRLAYRLYDVKTTYSGILKEKPLIPENRAFINIGYERRNWKLDYTLQWIGTKRIPALDGGNIPESYSPSYFQMNAQITRVFSQYFEVYLGGENLTNYTQHNDIVSADDPFSQNFDAAMIWGPAMGINIYAGLRYSLK